VPPCTCEPGGGGRGERKGCLHQAWHSPPPSQSAEACNHSLHRNKLNEPRLKHRKSAKGKLGNVAVLAVVRLKAQGLPWTELMDAAMVAVHSQQGSTAADIKAACVRVPMHHSMHEVCPVVLVHSLSRSASWAA